MIDLHIHSSLSDGTDSPEKIISLLKENNIKYFSITDHDILQPDDINKIYIKFSEKNFVKYIEGVEFWFTIKFKEYIRSIHILCYLPLNRNIAKKIENLTANIRAERNRRLANRIYNFMKKYYISNSYKKKDLKEVIGEIYSYTLLKNEEIKKFTKSHFAKILVKSGIAANKNQAFSCYLNNKNKLYVKKQELFLSDYINDLKRAFKFVIVAHFFHTFNKEIYDIKILKFLLDKLKDIGIDGFEVFYPEHDFFDERFLLKFVKQNSLIYTAGSDYHGLNKKNSIGKFSVQFRDENLDEIIGFLGLE